MTETSPMPPPRFSLRVKGMMVLAFPVLTLMGAVVWVLWLERATQSADAMVDRAVALRASVRALHNRTLEAEVAVFGRLWASDRGGRETVERVVLALDADLHRLSTVVSASQEPGQRMQEIEGAVRQLTRLLSSLASGSGEAAGRRRLLADE